MAVAVASRGATYGMKGDLTAPSPTSIIGEADPDDRGAFHNRAIVSRNKVTSIAPPPTSISR